ncbi:hypothetical protein [Nitratireductor basaltis]|uniref:YrhK domain-containing protein n=1 Tax=Nitratireductor basaltis TaxID=472175 RepID=A0A084U7B4_9HYPH|nr:hypothetical protein [Nitratireductor basaltis]KFB08850.1 hypothetical protein EL18_03104 [Nitratireductor basaltis]
MKDSEKEKIKLRANYLNGISLIFMGLGGLGPMFLAMQTMDFERIVFALSFLGAGIFSSWELHTLAQKELNKLKEDDA